MISRIDHIAIAVKDYEKALNFFRNILGAVPGATAKDDSMKYLWQIFSLGDFSRLELLKPVGKGSFLDNFFKDKKEGGFHHITLETPDIHKARKTLEDNDIPYFGFKEYGEFWKELFIHPRDAFGVLIQIAEFNPDDWLDESVKFPRGKKWSVKKGEKGCTLTFAHPGGGKVKLGLTHGEINDLISDLVEM